MNDLRNEMIKHMNVGKVYLLDFMETMNEEIIQ